MRESGLALSHADRCSDWPLLAHSCTRHNCSSSTNPIRGSIRQGIPLSKHSWQNTPPTEVPCCLPPIILSVPCNSVIPLLYYTKAGSPFKKKPSDWS